MRPFVKALAGLRSRRARRSRRCRGWVDDGSLRTTLLGADRTARSGAVVAALRDGAGVDGVLDTVIHAVSDRMLRYDTDGEFDFADDFGWLDITHGLTYAAATRWHHDRTVDGGERQRHPDLVRLVMFTAFLAQWTGRHEWHTGVGDEHEVEPLGPDLVSYGAELQRTSLLDGTTAFIVHAHAVKTSRAAVGRGAADGFASTARRDGTVHGRAEARTVRRGDRRAVDRLPQRSHRSATAANVGAPVPEHRCRPSRRVQSAALSTSVRDRSRWHVSGSLVGDRPSA